MLIEHKLKNNFNFNFLRDFLVKVVTHYIKIHCETYQNVNFLALIRYAFY